MPPPPEHGGLIGQQAPGMSLFLSPSTRSIGMLALCMGAGDHHHSGPCVCTASQALSELSHLPRSRLHSSDGSTNIPVQQRTLPLLLSAGDMRDQFPGKRSRVFVLSILIALSKKSSSRLCRVSATCFPTALPARCYQMLCSLPI